VRTLATTKPLDPEGKEDEEEVHEEGADLDPGEEGGGKRSQI